jgi:hypothetical protein
VSVMRVLRGAGRRLIPVQHHTHRCCDSWRRPTGAYFVGIVLALVVNIAIVLLVW